MIIALISTFMITAYCVCGEREERTIASDGERETEKQGMSLRADLVTGYFSHNHS